MNKPVHKKPSYFNDGEWIQVGEGSAAPEVRGPDCQQEVALLGDQETTVHWIGFQQESAEVEQEAGRRTL